jgi:sulfopyruvate decarboxylase subunit beta
VSTISNTTTFTNTDTLEVSGTATLLLSNVDVTNTGGTQHELFSLGDRDANLYAAGIGLVSQVGLGLAIALPNRRVIALDGDGSLLLNLGILPVLAQESPKNLLIVVFDNGLYESAAIRLRYRPPAQTWRR